MTAAVIFATIIPMAEFIIKPESAGQRLDVFLHGRSLDFSRAWVQKLIKKGNVLVNNRPTSPAYKLKVADRIVFESELPPEISLEPDSALASKTGLKIIFENDDFIVVDKPAGLSVHPSSSEPQGTLVNWLIHHWPPIKEVGDQLSAGNIRPGLVHRLDKDTSGVMVAAKNQKTFLWLKKQFQNHKVVKKYLALVNGSPSQDSGSVNLNIARSKTDPTKNTTSPTGGRAALTFWKVLKRFPDHTLLEVTPKTGRRHQIRVHLKSLGLPAAGDKKYSVETVRPGVGRAQKPKNLGRMFLHAEYLSFISPAGERFSFHSPLPDELEITLRNLPFVLE